MERKVWIRSQNENLYPNLYTFLVGPPGSGKTRAVEQCERLWRTLDTHKLAKVSLTKAALMDELAEAHRIVRYPIEMSFNSLLIASKEFGALMPTYDPDFLNALTYLYDCLKYDEKRRGNPEPLIIDNPQLNLIACTTPSYLLNTMPIGAWDQGFLSRTIIIYDEEMTIKDLDLMGERVNDTRDLSEALTHDMQQIGERCGRMLFTPPAAKAIEAWNSGGRQPVPAHPRLINYTTRRIVHLLKLCMVSCVDRGADNIDLFDYDRALGWMLEAEHRMPDIFLAMNTGGDAAVINETWHYCVVWQARNGKGVPVHQLWEFLSNRLPASSIDKVYQVMINSGTLKVMTNKEGPVVFAKPR